MTNDKAYRWMTEKEKQVILTWYNFDKQELVDAAVNRLKLEMKIQEVGSDEM